MTGPARDALQTSSASINKDALSQVETLIAMRTPSPQDRKATWGWVDQYAAGSEAVADLPQFGNGEAWVFSPHWLQQHYRRILRSGATKMLDALIGAYPRPLTRAELGDAAALATTGGTFSTYLSNLVRSGFADCDGDRVTATAVLMHGPDA